MSYGYYSGGRESWGTASFPEVAAEALQLDTYLKTVPENGLVVDIGAGVGLSLEAAICVRRPDVAVIALDPGFSRPRSKAAFAKDIGIVTDEYEACQQLLLSTSQGWRKHRVAGVAEAVPLRSSIADIVVSYSTIPEHTVDDRTALHEALRLLKVGRFALIGPIFDWDFEDWDTVVEEASKSGLLSAYENTMKTIDDAFGNETDAFFTVIRK